MTTRHLSALAAIIAALALAGCGLLEGFVGPSPDRLQAQAHVDFRTLLEHPRVDLAGRIERDPGLSPAEKDATLGAIADWYAAVDAAAQRAGISTQ